MPGPTPTASNGSDTPAPDEPSPMDDAAWHDVLQIPLVPLRAVLPTALQLGILGEEHRHIPDSVEDPIDPPSTRGYFLPIIPRSPTRVEPEQVSDAIMGIADRIQEMTNYIDQCRRVLEDAIAQREGIEAELQGHAPTDRYSTDTLRSLRDDTDLARRLVRWEVEAYRDWSNSIRGSTINNGKPTVVMIRSRNGEGGYIVIRQPTGPG